MKYTLNFRKRFNDQMYSLFCCFLVLKVNTHTNQEIRLYMTEWYAAAAKSLQSCLTLCDPIDSSPPGSAIPGILQARTLEWYDLA